MIKYIENGVENSFTWYATWATSVRLLVSMHSGLVSVCVGLMLPSDALKVGGGDSEKIRDQKEQINKNNFYGMSKTY